MIDHISLNVRDIARSKEFYAKALAPIGYKVMFDYGTQAVGLGVDNKPDFWLSQNEPGAPVHIAFHSRTRSLVKAFYEAAIAAGGKDNGPPGVRAIYHPTYYGAFVLDPDGHNIEVVCHEPYLD